MQLPQEPTIASAFFVKEQNISGGVHLSPAAPQPTSVIIPVLNEAENITQLLLRLHRTMTLAAIPYEAIVIDDRSTDDTAVIARETARDHALPVRVLTKQGTPGKSFALIEGFAQARFDVLAMIDGDLQYPPEALAEMNQRLGQADLIVADRRASYSDADRLRGGLSQIFTLIVTMLFGVDTDMQSGLKMFRRKIYDGVITNPGRWSFDLYLVTHAVFNRYKLANVPIEFQERHGGVSKVVPAKVALELLRTAVQLKVGQVARSLKARIFPTLSTDRQKAEAGVIALPLSTEVQSQVEYYASWLDADDRYNRTIGRDREETGEYIDDAMSTVLIDGKEVRMFAPFRYDLSALRTFTRGQIATLVVLVSACILGLVLFHTGMLVGIIAVLTVFYIGDLFVTLALSLRSLGRAGEEKIDDAVVRNLPDAPWPHYTVLCPLYREAAVVPQFVRAMKALDYPTDRLQVLFLTEENDAETRDSIRAMGLPSHFRILTVPDGEPRTKPRACNYGLLYATGDYIVIYDAEDIPDPLQLKKAVLAFANHGADLACVQAKLNFYNSKQNLLTRLFTAEYSAWFDMILPGLQLAQLALPLGGTSNHFRTETLGMLGAWDAFNVTEDCDLGLRLASYGLKTTILDSTTLEEANSQWKNWLRQRSRWIKGYMQTYLVHMRRPLRYLRPSRLRDFFSLQLLVGGKTSVLLINPFMLILLIMYLFFRPILNNVYHTLFPVSVLYMGSLCLIFGNFLYAYTHLIGCLKRGQYHLIKWALLMPVYWMMMSIAAFIAFYQLITKPHYWEKTNHGLHLSLQKKNKLPVKLPGVAGQTQESLR